MQKYVFMIGLVLAGCAGRPTNLPQGPAAYEALPVAGPAGSAAGYALGPLDKLRIDVLQEPELSLAEVPVDINGDIVLPMVGRVRAQGLTTTALADEIEARLERYLVQPRVAVNVTDFVSQQVTVEGAVNRAGMFPIPGRVTLTQAIALAQGTTDYSKLREIVVFRRNEGQRYAAQFDLAAIRRGEADDPTIRSGDIVVVGYSGARQIFRDIISVLPIAAGVFVPLAVR